MSIPEAPKPCVVILGAGPAGLSAGLWLKNLGLDALVLEQGDLAGGMQNLNFLDNNWVLGQPGVTGLELGRRFRDHAAQSGVVIRTGVQVIAIEADPRGGFALTVAGAEAIKTLSCAVVVIASGTRYRGAEVLGDALREVSSDQLACGPYAFQDCAALGGKRVLIVGGGDNAYENARLLLDGGAQVCLVIRSLARAQRQMREATSGSGACEILEHARVQTIRQSPEGVAVRLETAAGIVERVVDRIHVLAGYEPNTAFLETVVPASWRAHLALNDGGYLRVDSWGRTGVPGLYAAGDVCNPEFPSVVSALAQGAKVAKAVERDLRDTPLFSLPK